MIIQHHTSIGELKKILHKAILTYGDNDYQPITLTTEAGSVNVTCPDPEPHYDPCNPETPGKD